MIDHIKSKVHFKENKQGEDEDSSEYSDDEDEDDSDDQFYSESSY